MRTRLVSNWGNVFKFRKFIVMLSLFKTWEWEIKWDFRVLAEAWIKQRDHNLLTVIRLCIWSAFQCAFITALFHIWQAFVCFWVDCELTGLLEDTDARAIGFEVVGHRERCNIRLVCCLAGQSRVAERKLSFLQSVASLWTDFDEREKAMRAYCHSLHYK